VKILGLFDGSENAMQAARFAAHLAQKDPEVRVTLLQVLEMWETAAWGFF